jgi:DNA polymerase-3 subunit chi
MEVWFYHLQTQPLERVLPVLLEKCLERGWKAVVEVSSEERVKALDDLLWTWSDQSFLPHGPNGSADAAIQPVLLTTTQANVNGADVRLLADGARLALPAEGYKRIMLLFDGNDPVALTTAREDWKAAKAAADVSASYYQQDGEGRWVKKA